MNIGMMNKLRMRMNPTLGLLGGIEDEPQATGEDDYYFRDVDEYEAMALNCLLDVEDADEKMRSRLVTQFNCNRAASKTSMKGFSIRVHVGTPRRKQNLHARKPRERSASRSSRKSSGEGRQIAEAHLSIHIIFMYNIIYGQFSAKATAKDIMIYYETNAAAKLIRIRTKLLPGFRRRSSGSSCSFWQSQGQWPLGWRGASFLDQEALMLRRSLLKSLAEK